MLIKDETIECIDRLVQQGFILNRLWDRGMSVLDVKFAMNHFVSIFHTGLAHRFPVDWSDFLSEIEAMYNVTTKYYETPEDVSDYGDPSEFFNKNLEYHIETYEMIKTAINTATANGDINVAKELDSFVRVFNKFMHQAILLVDKTKLFNGNWANFDYMSDTFFLFKEEDGE